MKGTHPPTLKDPTVWILACHVILSTVPAMEEFVPQDLNIDPFD